MSEGEDVLTNWYGSPFEGKVSELKELWLCIVHVKHKSFGFQTISYSGEASIRGSGVSSVWSIDLLQGETESDHRVEET